MRSGKGGATGYIGRRLIDSLLARGHRVRALVRPESARRVPAGAAPVAGNALVRAVENPPPAGRIRIVDVPDIKKALASP